MKLQVEGVSELVLEVQSMERAVNFWSNKLGFPIVAQWGSKDGQFDKDSTEEIWATWLYIGGNTRLGLWLPRNFTEKEKVFKQSSVTHWENGLYDEGGIHVHFALFIKSDLFDETVTYIQSLGIEVTIRITGKERSVYFKDTENNVVEFFTRNMWESYNTEGR
jgi:catechol 2,3-dioxygenase-like lactoylglutathione lyase family enzyme